MKLSITTDYRSSAENTDQSLQNIAATGFSHIHWCQQWHNDYIYSEYEIRHIATVMKDYGLQLLDLHGSAGPYKNWNSAEEYARLSGVEIVKNRIMMTSALGGDAVVMHLMVKEYTDAVKRSLDELQKYAEFYHVSIALENGNFPLIRKIIQDYPPEYLGICYDSGHGNILSNDGLAHIAEVKDRLLVLHLHDNDASGDQHKLPFTGSVDWERLTKIIASSHYNRTLKKCISLEVSMINHKNMEEMEYLKQAYTAAEKLQKMVDAKQSGHD